MKKITLLLALIISGFVIKTATAQIPASVKVNIVSQPLWGPVGYDHVEYYYLPDVDAYYYVPKRQYIYQQNGQWMFTPALPARYKNYNVYNGYKVVINDPKPYLKNASYKSKYASYKGRKGQPVIKNSSDSKYYVIKNHPKNNSPKVINKSSSSKVVINKNHPVNGKAKKGGNQKKH
jgi:hypothetical protein